MAEYTLCDFELHYGGKKGQISLGISNRVNERDLRQTGHADS